ncbi:Do family serine endopeptidase [Marichromatium gracile]|uniref:Probable periplasmic serine endoprotease DegP-like n=1 Tax=Marichromatium gracile TaxID=1048 RepID=A0ABR5VJH1_MARGR|nr:Do family serine endopeptidase [Marichromatium gracile]KXX65888.1 serine protease [Marichromatium gracile]
MRAISDPQVPIRRGALAVALSMVLLGGGGATTLAVTPALAGPAAVQGLPSFADVAERVVPAVVNVTVVAETGTRLQGLPQWPEEMPVPEFFRRFFESPGLAQPRRVRGQGSGFLIDPEGHIVTNNHVIDGATEVTVVLNDGSSHEARVVGCDDKTDLALLKIETDGPLPHVELGDSAQARVGDWVLAVGNPFGLGGSVNAGIISARGRDIHSGPYDDYLQIDAAINRGNSGGPLFDAGGRVIGVNTAIYSPSGGNVGIGFAIPAEMVRRVVEDLRDKGHVERGWLGVRIQAVTPELAAALGRAADDGVLVAEVLEGTPAAASALRAGDLILSAGGTPITDYRDLPRLVAATPAGSTLELEVWREGRRQRLDVEIGRMPASNPQVAAAAPGAPLELEHLGLRVRALSPELRAELGIGPERAGVVVSEVVPGGPAARAGVRPGALISMFGNAPVDSPAALRAALETALEAGRESVVVRLERDGAALFVALPVAD